MRSPGCCSSSVGTHYTSSHLSISICLSLCSRVAFSRAPQLLRYDCLSSDRWKEDQQRPTHDREYMTKVVQGPPNPHQECCCPEDQFASRVSVFLSSFKNDAVNTSDNKPQFRRWQKTVEAHADGQQESWTLEKNRVTSLMPFNTFLHDNVFK